MSSPLIADFFLSYRKFAELSYRIKSSAKPHCGGDETTNRIFIKEDTKWKNYYLLLNQ